MPPRKNNYQEDKLKKLLFIIFIFCSPVHASLITYNFSGQIDDTRNLIAGISDGDTYQGELTFDSNALPSYYDGNYAEYIVLTQATFQVGVHSFDMAPTVKVEPNYYGPKRSIQIFNDVSHDSIYFTSGIDFEHSVSFGSGNTGMSFRLNMYDWSGIALNDVNIDTLPAFSLDQFNYNFLEIIAEDFSNQSNDFIVRATLENLQVASVPEPSTIWLLISAFLGLIIFKRKNTDRSIIK